MGFTPSIQLKCIGKSYRGRVCQASWYKFPVPCLGHEDNLLIILIDIALVRVIETGALHWKQDLKCNTLIDARDETVPASMVARGAPR
jgi:hypothetical protein